MSADVEVTVTVPGDLAGRLRLPAISTADVYAAGVLLAAAVKRTPRPFQVGNRVTFEDQTPATVIATAGEWLWVEAGDGPFTTRTDRVSHLEDPS